MLKPLGYGRDTVCTNTVVGGAGLLCIGSNVTVTGGGRCNSCGSGHGVVIVGSWAGSKYSVVGLSLLLRVAVAKPPSFAVPVDASGICQHTLSGGGLLRQQNRVGVALKPRDAVRAHPSSAPGGIPTR